MDRDRKIDLLLGLFVSLLIAMNLLGGKITSIFGVSVSVGIFIVPVTFLITDMVEEVHGKKMVGRFIKVGTLALIVVLLYTALFVWLEPHERYLANEAYVQVFSSSMRIMVASLVAFLVAQLHDMYAFSFWKRVTRGKALWLRNNFSTWVSQFIDTWLFMMIAFYQVAPKFTFSFVMSLVIPYYLFKVAFAVLDTPLVYIGVWWLKREQRDQLDIKVATSTKVTK